MKMTDQHSDSKPLLQEDKLGQLEEMGNEIDSGLVKQ